MQKVGHVKQLPVDLKALMDGLSSLLLPSQKPAFSPHMYEFLPFSPKIKYCASLCIMHLLKSATSFCDSFCVRFCYVSFDIYHQNFLICTQIISLLNLNMVSRCINYDTNCRLPLSEDPALAMAFSVARRAAAVPLLLVNGTYRKTIRSYLDSSILQYQLQRLNDHTTLKGQL